MDTRRIGRTLLAIVVAVAIAVPSALALRANAIPDSAYKYMKLGPKQAGSKYPNIVDIVGVEVSADGKYVRAGWTIFTRSGCVTAGGGRVQPYVNGIRIEKIPLKADGSFHGVDRSKGKYVRTHVSEIYGKFTTDGSYVNVRLRQKRYVYKAADMWARCDGRWLSFRPCYTEDDSIPPKCAPCAIPVSAGTRM